MQIGDTPLVAARRLEAIATRESSLSPFSPLISGSGVREGRLEDIGGAVVDIFWESWSKKMGGCWICLCCHGSERPVPLLAGVKLLLVI